jgi:hypothetical protein
VNSTFEKYNVWNVAKNYTLPEGLGVPGDWLTISVQNIGVYSVGNPGRFGADVTL